MLQCMSSPVLGAAMGDLGKEISARGGPEGSNLQSFMHFNV